KWVFLSTSYSAYHNFGNSRFSKVDIHRLQLAGFRFRLWRAIEWFSSGGVQYGRKDRRLAADIESGLTATTKTTSLSLRYHRGLSTVVGVAAVLPGDEASVLLTLTFSSRVSIDSQLFYVRATTSSSASLENMAAGVGLDVKLQSNLVSTIRYRRFFQQSQNL